jgi:D-glycerate 3-kinase
MTFETTRSLVARALAAAAGTDEPPEATVAAYAAVAEQVAQRAQGDGPLIVGICGSQGSGKSTLARVLQQALDHAGLPTAQFSLDDIYLTLAERARLAETVHPLLRTRGVPGTHDVALGLATLSALEQAGPDSETALPAFDKSSDDRRPQADWPYFRGRPRVILFEGWCVGARPQDEQALAKPINALERDSDPDGTWRRFVNQRLQAEYQALFGRLDMLVLLRAPSFETVFAWRKQQDDHLREKLRTQGSDVAMPGVMDDAALERFIRHYERITRHILAEMPPRADICLSLRPDRSIADIALARPQ